MSSYVGKVVRSQDCDATVIAVRGEKGSREHELSDGRILRETGKLVVLQNTSDPSDTFRCAELVDQFGCFYAYRTYPEDGTFNLIPLSLAEESA